MLKTARSMAGAHAAEGEQVELAAPSHRPSAAAQGRSGGVGARSATAGSQGCNVGRLSGLAAHLGTLLLSADACDELREPGLLLVL